ncbi:MAG TPA: prepilin-type N-terminal cleavage/methylation domain-containing protein [Drouetiella sp.]|jgi:Prokaryotic N-terminal methylation motif
MRNQSGMSLIEMLSTLFITAFIGAIMTEIAVTQNVVSLKASTKMDSLVAARRFFSSFEHDVHMARSFVSITPTSLQLETPVYATSGAQVGLPQMSSSQWLINTVTYSLIADTDPTRTGQYMLQKTVVSPSSTTTTILVSGIVGPMDPANTTTPKIFRYYRQTSAGTTLIDAPTAGFTNPLDMTQIAGARMTVEIAPENSARSDATTRSFAFASDVFSRTNVISP